MKNNTPPSPPVVDAEASIYQKLMDFGEKIIDSSDQWFARRSYAENLSKELAQSFASQASTQQDFVVKEDMICPATKEHCDDECCPVGAICNLSGNGCQKGSSPQPVQKGAGVWVKASDEVLSDDKSFVDAAIKDFEKRGWLIAQSPSSLPVSGYTLQQMVKNLVELRQHHIAPYNLGEEGKVNDLILAMEKEINKSVASSLPVPAEGVSVADDSDLWGYFHDEHKLTLLQGELHDIISHVEKYLTEIKYPDGIKTKQFAPTLPTDEQIEEMAKKACGQNYGYRYEGYVEGVKAIRSLLGSATPVKDK